MCGYFNNYNKRASYTYITNSLGKCEFLFCVYYYCSVTVRLLFSADQLMFSFTNSRIDRKLSIPPLHIIKRIDI
nr:MAG TPA: hypothetical protein [Caudoviricetes sp.]